MTMTQYQPSWEKSSNRWDTEPEIWEDLYLEEEKEEIEDIEISEEDFDEEFDLDKWEEM